MMTTKVFPAPFLSRMSALLFVLSLILTTPFDGFAQRKKSPTSKRTVAAKQVKKTPDKKQAKKTNARETAKSKSGKNSRDEKRLSKRELARQAKASKKEKSSKQDKSAKSAKNDRDDRKGKKLSRRERQQEAARRAAERRAELARREAERREAARRAELARLARIAAIRAADQALRNETQTNILQDDLIGEDLQIRSVAIKALGNHAGSVVVMNPENGRVYTVVNQNWGLRRGFKPCSTIKIVTGLAGVTHSVIPPIETVNAGGNRYRLDLTDSLAYSNNTYFQNVGGRVGFDMMMNAARELGLGQATGINHTNESAGRVPLFKTGYAVNHMSSHGDDFAVTPLQLATMTSAIANGGTLLVPHLPRTPEENVNFKTVVRRKLTFSKESLQRIQPGMIGAVNYGTGKRAYDVTQTVAGKTGSCIDNGTTWVGLFTSYAPVQDPQLSVTVVLKGSGQRGKFAAGVAGEIFRNLNSRFGKVRNGATQLATAPIVAPRPKLNAAAAAAVSDEDEEGDATTVDSLAAPATDVNPRPGVRAVIKPYERRPNVTAQPVSPATAQPSSNTQPSEAQPLDANPAAPGKFDKSNSGERPRRVTPLANQPNQSN